MILYIQVEISGGRGKPSALVDKDEGLGKVNRILITLPNMPNHSSIFLSSHFNLHQLKGAWPLL